MKVFKCLLTGDEMFSDSYPHTEAFDGSVWEVKAKYITKKNEQFAIAADDELDEDAGGETVVNIVDAFHLNEIELSKKDFMATIKLFLKTVSDRLEADGKGDRVADFKKGATAAVKLIVGQYKEFQIFTGESFSTEGSLAFAYQKEQTDEGPTFLFFKDFLKEEKF